MRIPSLIFILIILFALSVQSNTSRPMIKTNAVDECPHGQIEVVTEDCKKRKFTLNAAVSGWFANIKPILKWNASGARIIRGQGTWSIKTIGSKSRGPVVVALTVTGDGLPKACIIHLQQTVEPCR